MSVLFSRHYLGVAHEWSTVCNTAVCVCMHLSHSSKLPLDYVQVALFTLLPPLTGWIGESWLGRYRAIAVGLVLSLVTVLTLQAAFVIIIAI